MMSVCFKEKLQLPSETLVDIITSANNDVRLVLNHLSMLAADKNSKNLEAAKKYVKLVSHYFDFVKILRGMIYCWYLFRVLGTYFAKFSPKRTTKRCRFTINAIYFSSTTVLLRYLCKKTIFQLNL